MKKHERAIGILNHELIKLAAVVVTRYLAHKDSKFNTEVEALEWLNDLYKGTLKKKDEDYLEQYLNPLREMNATIKLLKKDQEKTL